MAFVRFNTIIIFFPAPKSCGNRKHPCGNRKHPCGNRKHPAIFPRNSKPCLRLIMYPGSMWCQGARREQGLDLQTVICRAVLRLGFVLNLGRSMSNHELNFSLYPGSMWRAQVRVGSGCRVGEGPRPADCYLQSRPAFRFRLKLSALIVET